jgi:hypothetical protein
MAALRAGEMCCSTGFVSVSRAVSSLCVVFLRCFKSFVSPLMHAGTGPGGPPTFLLRQKSRQKRRPECLPPLGVPEKEEGRAGSGANSPAAQTSPASCPRKPPLRRLRTTGTATTTHHPFPNPSPRRPPLKGRECFALLHTLAIDSNAPSPCLFLPCPFLPFLPFLPRQGAT